MRSFQIGMVKLAVARRLWMAEHETRYLTELVAEHPNLKQAAAVAGMTVDGLQRTLNRRGVKYIGHGNRYRRQHGPEVIERAKQMRSSGEKVVVIARTLGTSDSWVVRHTWDERVREGGKGRPRKEGFPQP